jgi:FtsH-binding integral membrane protein
MSTAEYGAIGVQNRTRTLFGQVMWLVAATAGLFALGAYLGRSLGNGVAFVFYLLAFGCLIAMRFAIRRSPGLTIGLLLGVGLLMGLGTSPTLAYYAQADPQALWEAGGATALFIAGCGAFGYATRTDLSGVARVAFWALLGLIVFGIVLIFVHIPGGAVIYSVLGLVIFAALTMVDFQRLRRSTDMDSAPLIAASIFLDALNVFTFFLQLFGGRGRN